MAVHAYSLPEARERVGTLQDVFVSNEDGDLSEDQVLDIAATLIGRADDLLAHLPTNPSEDLRETTALRVLTETLRKTAFLLMQEADPESAWYWTPENQARIREEDELLTPRLRAEVLVEAIADYAALDQDPVARAAMLDEDALWDTTTGDGLDAD